MLNTNERCGCRGESSLYLSKDELKMPLNSGLWLEMSSSSEGRK